MQRFPMRYIGLGPIKSSNEAKVDNLSENVVGAQYITGGERMERQHVKKSCGSSWFCGLADDWWLFAWIERGFSMFFFKSTLFNSPIPSEIGADI